MSTDRDQRAKSLMALSGVVVVALALLSIAWNVGLVGVPSGQDVSLRWEQVFFGVLGVLAGAFLLGSAWMWRRVVMARWRYRHALAAAVVNAAVLVLLIASGPPLSGTALAMLPLLAAITLGMLFDNEPAEDQPHQLDPETLRRNARRLGLLWGVLAALAAVMAVIESVFRTLADTGFAFPLAALLFTNALYSRGEARNPQFTSGPSSTAESRSTS
ncbi:hypothetical protein [Kocuria arenosa]|uniref:hypothetical protein n=1 Tax=Kocuria arenosa TaxID=3071446 RepID=UPI0034D48D13